MERGEQKPDLSGRVNGFEINIFRRGQGFEVSAANSDGQEIVLFRYAPPEPSQEEKQPLPTTTPPAASPPSSLPSAPEQVPQPREEAKTPLTVVGTVERIEGMGETPNTHEPIFRFSVRWRNPKTSLEEVRTVATFKHIAQTLNQFYTSSDPNIKLQPGRQITITAWDHPESASIYPSRVNYLNFPPITNPKTQKRR